MNTICCQSPAQPPKEACLFLQLLGHLVFQVSAGPWCECVRGPRLCGAMGALRAPLQWTPTSHTMGTPWPLSWGHFCSVSLVLSTLLSKPITSPSQGHGYLKIIRLERGARGQHHLCSCSEKCLHTPRDDWYMQQHSRNPWSRTGTMDPSWQGQL